MGASDRDVQIALMTALQESGLRNINYGDRDSLGLFQQRPSQGWGTKAQVTDPAYASRKFFTGLLGLKGRDSMPEWQAAARVQRPAKKYETYYQKHAQSALDLMGSTGGTPATAPAGSDPAAMAEAATAARSGELAGTVSSSLSNPLESVETGAVGVEAPQAVGVQAVDAGEAIGTESVLQPPRRIEGDAFLPTTVTEQEYKNLAGGGQGTGKGAELVAYAKQFLGTPYKWGGSGPLGFDCSGLMSYIFQKVAGVNLPRVSAQQAGAGVGVALDDLQAGDMLFWDNSSRNKGADHVAMYIGNGQYIEAPQPGGKVQIRTLNPKSGAWARRVL